MQPGVIALQEVDHGGLLPHIQFRLCLLQDIIDHFVGIIHLRVTRFVGIHGFHHLAKRVSLCLRALPTKHNAQLLNQNTIALHAAARQTHDKIGLALGCEDESDASALAMSENADRSKVRLRAQILQAGQCIGGIVKHRGARGVAGAFSRAAVVITQTGNAHLRQAVGYYEEGLMVKNFFVSILLPTTADHQDHRHFTLASRGLWITQGAG